jgi:hypothetical protein
LFGLYKTCTVASYVPADYGLVMNKVHWQLSVHDIKDFQIVLICVAPHFQICEEEAGLDAVNN